MTSRSGIIFGTCAVLVGGTLLIASAQPAQASQANQNVGFRDFRQQNPGLDRHTVRQMFNADRKIDREIGSHKLVLPNINSVSPGSVAQTLSTPHHVTRTERHTAHVNSDGRKSLQATDTGRLVRLNSGVDLDLTSEVRNIVLGKELFSDAVSVQISVGGESKTLTAGSQVTAAEYVAVKQVLAGQTQSVSINRSGAAVGGAIDLSALTVANDVMRASSLVVSKDVTTYGDFGKHSDFRLSGDLINYGTVNALSSDSHVRGGTLHAEDITNHAGGLISSTVDLTLDAAGNLNNDGTIVSSQGLTLSAGGAVNNNGSIRSAGSVNLSSSSINNHGLIQSRTGDVNLDGPASLALDVNNSNGTIAALNGAINVRSTEYSGTSNSTVNGGDLLSRELNLYSGQGLTSVDVNQLTGVVNESGLAAHVNANTDVLNIGNVCLTGDPTFFNQGNIAITSALTPNEDLVIVASGNIVCNQFVNIQAGDANTGYNITLIAGADFTTNGTGSSTVPGGIPDGVSLSGKSSKTGGSIQFAGNNNVFAQSTDNVNNDNGGNILFAAFGGKGTAGQINLAPATLRTGGKNAGNNGSITLIAGIKSGLAVDLGTLDTTGGAGTPGNIIVTTANPVSTIKGARIDFDPTGLRTSTATLTGASSLNKADINLGDPTGGVESKSSAITQLSAGGNITVIGQMEALTSNIGLSAGGTITGDSFITSIKAASVDLEGGGDIGSVGAYIRIDTPLLDVNRFSKGSNVYVKVLGTGATNAEFLAAREQLFLDASGRDLTFTVSSDMNNLDLTFNSLVNGTNVSSKVDFFNLVSLSATADLNALNFGLGKSITLSSGRDVGTFANFDVFQVGIKSINVFAARDSYVGSLDKKAVISGTAGRDFGIVFTQGGIVGNATATTGAFAVQSLLGTLTVDGNVSSNGFISVDQAGTKSSSKIAFAANSSLTTTNGDVTIKVGPTAVTQAVTPANVSIDPQAGGTVTITGAGVKAKPPSNLLQAVGAGIDININNGFKAGNITFGGGVAVSAN